MTDNYRPGEVERLRDALTAKADECQRHAEASFYPKASSEYRAKEWAFREAASICAALTQQEKTDAE